MENLRQDLTVMIQQELKTGKVQVGIDEGAFRKAKSKIDSLFKDIGRFIRGRQIKTTLGRSEDLAGAGVRAQVFCVPKHAPWGLWGQLCDGMAVP